MRLAGRNVSLPYTVLKLTAGIELPHQGGPPPSGGHLGRIGTELTIAILEEFIQLTDSR